MTSKQHAIALTRPWHQGSSFREHLREIMNNLKRSVEIPTGYQDENGFHFGPEPALKEIQWPSA